jgi:hypothetical protein
MKDFSLDQSSQLGYQLFCESASDARDIARDSATVALGVLDGKRMSLGLIVEIRQGKIGTVKAFDSAALGAPLTLSAESFERMWHALKQNLNVLVALLCDSTTFEGLVNAENKLGYLAAVGHAQPYFYRVELA